MQKCGGSSISASYATEPFTDAGAKGPAYALFRDALPDALRIFRARKEGKPLEEIPPVE
jgi:hypothetical protein